MRGGEPVPPRLPSCGGARRPGRFRPSQVKHRRVLTARGDFADAERAFDEALAIQQERNDRPRIAILENGYGDLEEARGNYDAALERYKRALQLRGQLGDEAALAESHNNVGYVYFLRGNYDTASTRPRFDSTRSTSTPRSLALPQIRGSF